jgi:hypothetical protein
MHFSQPSSIATQDMLPGLSVLRQVDDKYIVCHVRSNGRAPSMMLMVDQHAAHERVRLERFLAILASQAEDEVGAHGRCFGEPCPPMRLVSHSQTTFRRRLFERPRLPRSRFLENGRYKEPQSKTKLKSQGSYVSIVPPVDVTVGQLEAAVAARCLGQFRRWGVLARVKKYGTLPPGCCGRGLLSMHVCGPNPWGPVLTSQMRVVNLVWVCCSDDTVSVSAIADVIHKGIHAHEMTDVIEVCACVIGPSPTSLGYGWPVALAGSRSLDFIGGDRKSVPLGKHS